MKKTFLITGGAGFIGSNFLHYIFNAYPNSKIIVLDLLTYAGNVDNFPVKPNNNSGRFEFWYGNVTNSALVEELVERADIVVHFAAETHVTRSIYDNRNFFETDVIGTQTIANAVLKNKKSVERFIHISTSEVYGTAENCTFMDENHPLNPASPYAAAKVGADRLVYSYVNTYDIPATIVRPFNNYGPRQHLEKAIPRFITSLLLGEKLTVHGKGEASRDWIFVEDTCRGIDAILSAPIDKVKGEVFNLGTSRTISIRDVALSVTKLFGFGEEKIIYNEDRPGQVDCHLADISKAENVLGWRPKVTFEEGLKDTIVWYKNNRQMWEKQIWMREVPIMLKDGKRVIH
ncbi:dTDP-glucose 4,6-dehydratase [Sulfurospirillum barnesii]|uniref:dTDP-D-glucose 4,6-dehydratase n=1 Tax=Sulfurospirillum barnesii (strain ATCC 700032 / DSM 10660 / SES-3) TaxID=760154 RepID=I3Y0K1_SULBS|nr:GDP-mannose 4,6-dehydratase [Sulfurospirillum barnesii]AFL69725.1 dTDP-D-glucose 4,6-dehydratase [Sulfurospirillum barnesii SES-3]